MFKAGEVKDKFVTLVNPEMPMPQAAYNINHISDNMLKKAPVAKKVIPQFLKFIQGTYLAAYNARFDQAFLQNELELLKIKLPQEILAVDVLMMARRMLADLDSYALSSVAESLDLADYQKHRALGDIEVTAEIFKFLLNNVEEAGITNFKDFFNMFGIHREVISEMNAYKEAAILRAIDLGARLRIKYFTASTAQLSEREVTPHELKEEGGFKYLVGHCHLRKDQRTFKISNITQLQLLS
jgi:DNA polymerase III epsilon subunit family exonuclease